MFEFVAIGPERDQYWRREIAPDEVVRLGRIQDSGWEVPWDRRISRDHADLILQGDRLLVRCVSSARNSAFLGTAPQREFTIAVGEQFRIGDTVFRLETAGARTPLDQMDNWFGPEETEVSGGPPDPDEVYALTQELAALRQQLADNALPSPEQEETDHRIQELLADIQELKGMWEAESKSLRDAKSQLAEDNEKLHRAVKRQESQIAELQQRHDELVSKLEAKNESLQQAEQRAQQLAREAQSLEAKLEAFNSQLSEAEAGRRRAEFEVRQFAEQESQSSRENETLRAEVDSLRAELRAKEAVLRKAELTARHRTEEADRYQSELSEMRSELINLRVRTEGSGSGSGSKRGSSAAGRGDPTQNVMALHQGSTLNKLSTLGSFGQYKILEQIGQGGMGTVFKAMHTKLERIVALKIVTGGRLQSEDKLNRFDREMKAIGRLQHPNLVHAMDAGENNNCVFLVMEYVEGLDVSELVRELGPLSIADACEIIRQAAVGLEYIHRQGLVHRDIKPSNLMITPSDQVKILDLGLALLADLGDGLTQTGQLMGTLDYMPPEQAGNSHQVDYRADIYSLGCTFYQLLTGDVPFGGKQYKTVVTKILAHVESIPPPLAEQCPDLPPKLAKMLTSMLAKNPDQRPQSLPDVATELEAHRSGASLSSLLVNAGVLELDAAAKTPTINTNVDTTEWSVSDDPAARSSPFDSVDEEVAEEVDSKLDPR